MARYRYITTTLPYVNADPHIGFALELIQADTLARFWRLQGDVVLFSTGTDEHGQKIFETAQAKGQDVQEYVDHYAKEVQKLKGILNISYDTFVRTTNSHHISAAQEMWKRCEQSGDIYKKKFKGLYCVGCEKYLTKRDLVDGECPLHPGKKPVELEEENYFFRFSKYQDELVAYLEDASVVIPDWRREEALAFAREGLEDFSISREKSRLSWGIPVPGDGEQVMYVWFDALTNYISTLGWPEDTEEKFQKFWIDGDTYQMAGKDQVRFQSLMWQAMLLSARLPHTDHIFYHGFINSGGQRMSKSLGNIIHPYDLVDKYGIDAARYILLRHVHPTEDSDVSWDKFDEWYTAHLVNGLGNLISRIMKMAEDNLDGPVSVAPEEPDEEIEGYLCAFEFQKAMDFIWNRVGELDDYIQAEEPFKVVKTNEQEGRKMIAHLVRELYGLAKLLVPFMPETAEKIEQAIAHNKKPESVFPRL